MSEFQSPHEQEAFIAQFKKETNERFAQLLKTGGSSLVEISRMLGADKFLTVERSGRKSPVYRFDVQGFIQLEIEQHNFLRLPDVFTQLNETIVPPDEGETIRTGKGGGIEKKEIIPRSKYLVELLSEIGQPYQVISGTNGENMVRSESYQIFVIPGLERIVLINDEEDNVSFVIHSTDPEEHQLILGLKKSQLKSMGDEKVQPVKYPGSPEEWKEKIRALLTQPFVDETEEENKKGSETAVEIAPEGWKHLYGVSKQLEVSRNSIQKIVDTYRASNPGWFHVYRNSASSRIELEFYHPDLIQKCRETLAARPSSAPEGWKTNTAVARENKVNLQTTQRIIEAARSEHPKWFVPYEGDNGAIREYLSPELQEVVKQNLERRVKAPDGWASYVDLVNPAIPSTRKRIREVVTKFRDQHPEWIQEFANSQGRFSEYFHPDLVAQIQSVLDAIPEKPPSGWVTAGALATTLDINYTVIRRLSNEYREEHPEWFKMYTGSGGRSEHLHPELVVEMQKEVAGRTSAPLGWKSRTAIADEAKVEPSTMKTLITEKFSSVENDHPEWFGEYTGLNGKVSEYYHPEMVTLILKELAQREMAPAGWFTVNGLSKTFKGEGLSAASRYKIKTIVERYRSSNPEWFKMYKLPQFPFVFMEHYHPELAKIIRGELE